MEITKNKWLNLAIFFVVVLLAVIVALLVVSFKNNKDGVLKATLDLGSAKSTNPAASLTAQRSVATV